MLEITGFTEITYIIRILAAAVCGILIGYERKNQSKAAGIRTHCVVACASALMMVLSKYAYSDVTSYYGELMKIDPSRIASGVVSGIGFLGAGMIFVHHKTVTGLTTAAGIWATSGVGMAIGAGMYITGFAAAFILVFLQIILHNIPRVKPEHVYSDENENNLINAMKQAGIEILKAEQEKPTLAENTVYTITVTAEPKPDTAAENELQNV